MAECQNYELSDGNEETCHNEIQIWATYPTGCPGVQWWGLCLGHFVHTIQQELEYIKIPEFEGQGGTWHNDTQLVAYQDPSTIDNFGFPQYGKVEK